MIAADFCSCLGAVTDAEKNSPHIVILWRSKANTESIVIRDHKLLFVFHSPFLEVSLHVGLDGGDLHDDPLLLAVAHVHQLLRRRL